MLTLRIKDRRFLVNPLLMNDMSRFVYREFIFRINSISKVIFSLLSCKLRRYVEEFEEINKVLKAMS